MARNCSKCGLKVSIFKQYVNGLCEECYDKYKRELEIEQEKIRKQELKEMEKIKNNKLNSAKKYLLSSRDNLDKIDLIMQMPLHYEESFSKNNITMDYILYKYLIVILENLKEDYSLKDLKRISISKNACIILEKLNYIFKEEFDSSLFIETNKRTYETLVRNKGRNSVYNMLEAEECVVEFSTLDELKALLYTNISDDIEIISIISNNYRDAKLNGDYNIAKEYANEIKYKIRIIYYQLAISILCLVVYSKEIEKFLNHDEISKIICKLENEIHNEDYIIEKIYQLYINIYKENFSIDFNLEDIKNILRIHQQEKERNTQIKTDELIRENIEDYIYDIDIQPLIKIDDENDIISVVENIVKENVINLQENISLEKLLYIENKLGEKTNKILEIVNKQKAILEKERILNGDFSKEKELNDKELDYSGIKDGYEFECYIADLYKMIGFEILEVTSKSGDQGADILMKNNNLKYAVQVKYYSNPVGNKAVQEIVAAKKFYGADKAMVVTNSTYTLQAKELAKANDVILVDKMKLDELINNVKKKGNT